MKLWWIIFLAVTSFSVASFGIAQEVYIPNEIATIPWGTSESDIGLIDAEEERLAVGPSSFSVDDDGNIYILDSINKRVHNRQKMFQFKNNGINNIPISENGIDIALDREKNLIVLHEKQVVKYDRVGNQIEKYEIPKHIKLPTNIVVNEKGFSLIENGREGYLFEQKDKKFHLTPSKGIPSKYSSDEYSTEKVDNNGRIKNSRNNSEIIVLTANPLASLILIGTDRSGNVFTVVETFISMSPINVEREVRKYDPKGNLKASFRLDMSYYTYPNNDIVLDSDGNIYQMRPTFDGVQIIQWNRQ